MRFVTYFTSSITTLLKSLYFFIFFPKFLLQLSYMSGSLISADFRVNRGVQRESLLTSIYCPPLFFRAWYGNPRKALFRCPLKLIFASSSPAFEVMTGSPIWILNVFMFLQLVIKTPPFVVCSAGFKLNHLQSGFYGIDDFISHLNIFATKTTVNPIIVVPLQWGGGGQWPHWTSL